MNAEKLINTIHLHSNVKRLKTEKHKDLEDALCTWITQMSAKNVTMIRDIIRVQAKVFGQKMNITDFEYSSGLLNRFKN